VLSLIRRSLFNEESLKRATVNRIKDVQGLSVTRQPAAVVFLHAPVDFEHSRKVVEQIAPVGKKIVPSSSCELMRLSSKV